MTTTTQDKFSVLCLAWAAVCACIAAESGGPSYQVPAPDVPEWPVWGVDKFAHLLVGFLATWLWWPLGVITGAAKEVSDLVMGSGTFNPWDFAWSCFGSVAAWGHIWAERGVGGCLYVSDNTGWRFSCDDPEPGWGRYEHLPEDLEEWLRDPRTHEIAP